MGYGMADPQGTQALRVEVRVETGGDRVESRISREEANHAVGVAAADLRWAGSRRGVVPFASAVSSGAVLRSSCR